MTPLPPVSHPDASDAADNFNLDIATIRSGQVASTIVQGCRRVAP